MKSVRFRPLILMFLFVLIGIYIFVHLYVFFTLFERDAKIVHVYDGTTVLIKDAEEYKRTRLIGITEPTEKADARTARTKLAEVFDTARDITIKDDPVAGEKTEEGDYLFYVTTTEKNDLAERILQEGWANVVEGQEFERRSDYEKAALNAEEEGKGMWQ